jgi:hypothetical protein
MKHLNLSPDSVHETPLVLVHRGPRLPRHAAANARNATRSNSLPVVLITDAVQSVPDLPGVQRLDLSWYDAEPFSRFRSRSRLPAGSCGGFWLAHMERFFILGQAMRHFGWTALMHVENDVHVFDVSDIPRRLDRIGSSFFLPEPYPEALMASIAYVNDVEALEDFCRWASQDPGDRFGLRLLADYAAELPEAVTLLPTDLSLCPEGHSVRHRNPRVTVEELGGIVDANAVGQWLLGVDPRNVVGPVRNGFQHDAACVEFARARFDFDADAGLSVEYGGRREQVRCLHVHAKVNDRLADPRYLRRVVERNTAGQRSTVHRGIPPVRSGGRPLLPSRISHPFRKRRFRGI